MNPVPQSQLASLLEKPYSEWIAQANLEGRSTVEGFLKTVNAGYDARSISAFVDSFEDPKTFLVIGVINAVVLDKPTCAIFFLGGDFEVSKALETAKAYATLHGCGDVAISSWRYLDASHSIPPTLCESFDTQEIISTHLL